MERLAKKPKITELLARYGAYSIIPRGVAMEILMKSDVQDALSFVQGASSDVRFHIFLQITREDAIWKFWFERDLKIIFDYFETIEQPIDDIWKGIKLKEGPAWKVYYLWFRLLMSAYQWDIFVQNTDTYRSILTAYPEGSEVRYVRLNELQLRTPQETVFLDFRSEFVRIAITSRSFRPQHARDIQYSVSWLHLLAAKNRSFFKNKFSSMPDNIVSTFDSIYDLFHFHVITSANLLSRFSFINYRRYISIDYLQHPPRLIERTSLIVASCITCGTEAKYVEESTKTNTFCEKTCQSRFHY